ncbi:MAG: anthranilate synthase component I [bacterium]
MEDVFKSQIKCECPEFKVSPVFAFSTLYKNEPYAFLYESLEQNGNRGRFSFIGAVPKIVFQAKKNKIKLFYKDRKELINDDPFLILRKLINPGRKFSSFAPFSGGAVGYVSYDAIRYLEKIPDHNIDELNIPDVFFVFPEEVIVFDHKYKTAQITLYNNDRQRLNELVRVLYLDECIRFSQDRQLNTIRYEPNLTPSQFFRMVNKAKHYIFAGDIFQVVLSQRFKAKINASPLNIYSALRLTNPSPYMYYLKLDDITIIGSSPEILVKLNNGIAISRPLAGTRPRGKNKIEDKRLERELLRDEKELAEHIMLVDLARNDLGRVCRYGTIKPNALLKVERYSKVMHIVSNIVGELRKDCDAIDLFISSFPAGTVSGAPKIRAMEIIDELEPIKRGFYAGAIGYFDFGRNMDFCIGIRTILIKNNTAYIQGGAGIVADSIPEKEYQETINKTKALKLALEMV